MFILSQRKHQQSHLEADERTLNSDGSVTVLRCSYDDGYHVQRVYACVPCMAKAKQTVLVGPALAAHALAQFGVCQHCFLVCHALCGEMRENVDYFAVDRKRDFRCDCGTKRAQCECILKQPTVYNGQSSVCVVARAFSQISEKWAFVDRQSSLPKRLQRPTSCCAAPRTSATCTDKIFAASSVAARDRGRLTTTTPSSRCASAKCAASGFTTARV